MTEPIFDPEARPGDLAATHYGSQELAAYAERLNSTLVPTDKLKAMQTQLAEAQARITALTQEKEKDLAEIRKYVSPLNANTEMRPLIRDLAQAKIAAMGNCEELQKQLAAQRVRLAQVVEADELKGRQLREVIRQRDSLINKQGIGHWTQAELNEIEARAKK